MLSFFRLGHGSIDGDFGFGSKLELFWDFVDGCSLCITLCSLECLCTSRCPSCQWNLRESKKKAPQTHRRTDQRGKQRKTCPNTSKTCFHPKKHVSKNKKTQTQQSENLHFQKQNTSKKRWSAVLIFLRRREDRKRCRALGVARAGREKREHKKKHETRTNPPKILMFRWFWRVFLCFVDFVCFLCVFLCFLWFLDFHRQLQMRVFLLVLEEVKWRGLAAWAYKSSLRFLDVHDFFVWHKNALWCTLLLCWVRWVL